MVHIKEHLLLIGKSSPCSGGSRFPLSEWSFRSTICPTQFLASTGLLLIENVAHVVATLGFISDI